MCWVHLIITKNAHRFDTIIDNVLISMDTIEKKQFFTVLHTIEIYFERTINMIFR